MFGDATTGAENDIRQATQLARSMVGRFGMRNEVGSSPSCPRTEAGGGVRRAAGLRADAAARR